MSAHVSSTEGNMPLDISSPTGICNISQTQYRKCLKDRGTHIPKEVGGIINAGGVFSNSADRTEMREQAGPASQHPYVP